MVMFRLGRRLALSVNVRSRSCRIHICDHPPRWNFRRWVSVSILFVYVFFLSLFGFQFIGNLDSDGVLKLKCVFFFVLFKILYRFFPECFVILLSAQWEQMRKEYLTNNPLAYISVSLSFNPIVCIYQSSASVLSYSHRSVAMYIVKFIFMLSEIMHWTPTHITNTHTAIISCSSIS